MAKVVDGSSSKLLDLGTVLRPFGPPDWVVRGTARRTGTNEKTVGFPVVGVRELKSEDSTPVNDPNQ